MSNVHRTETFVVWQCMVLALSAFFVFFPRRYYEFSLTRFVRIDKISDNCNVGWVAIYMHKMYVTLQTTRKRKS